MCHLASVAVQRGTCDPGERLGIHYFLFSVRPIQKGGCFGTEQANLPCRSVPDSDAGIQASRCYPEAVESNGIDLAVVTLESMETAPFRDTPNPSCSIVAARNDNISLDFEAADTSLVPNKDVAADACPDVPHSEGGISRARNRRVGIRHL